MAFAQKATSGDSAGATLTYSARKPIRDELGYINPRQVGTEVAYAMRGAGFEFSRWEPSQGTFLLDTSCEVKDHGDRRQYRQTTT